MRVWEREHESAGEEHLRVWKRKPTEYGSGVWEREHCGREKSECGKGKPENVGEESIRVREREHMNLGGQNIRV
jgi:hypothetical protein